MCEAMCSVGLVCKEYSIMCVLWVWCARNTVSCVFCVGLVCKEYSIMCALCGCGVQRIQYHVCSVGVVCKEYSTMLTNIFEVLGIHSFSSCKARESHSCRGDTALQ